MKTAFKNTKVARQQKEKNLFSVLIWTCDKPWVKEVTSGKPWLVTRKTPLMEKKAKHGRALPEKSPLTMSIRSGQCPPCLVTHQLLKGAHSCMTQE